MYIYIYIYISIFYEHTHSTRQASSDIIWHVYNIFFVHFTIPAQAPSVTASLVHADASLHLELVLLWLPNMDELLRMVTDARLPLRGILERQKEHSGRKLGWKRAYSELHRSRDIDTLHGKLTKQLMVVGQNGASMRIDYVSPIPLIVHACAVSIGFFRLMQMCVQQAPGNVLRLVFYHDAVTPGNNLRPDQGRSFISFMWSFLELPQWLRHRGRLRWLTFSYVQKKQMKRARITIVNIVKAIMLDMFGDPDCNFQTTGVLLRHGAESQLVRMKFKTCPQDWLAQVDMFGMKGAQGLNPCPLCENCMGRRKFFEDDSGFVHVLSPLYEKFRLRTRSRMREVLDCISSIASDHPEQLDDVEKATGLCWNPDGLLFDKDLAGIIDLSEAIFADTAHCLLASGGVAQFHINQFVLRIIDRTDFDLPDLDCFAGKVTLPRSVPKLSNTFFQDRIVQKQSAHLRGFASEVRLAVEILGLFVEMILEPASIAALSAEIECFKHLRELLDHISAGTYEHAHPALDACRKHHQCFLALYPVCAAPKLHYTWHAILAWISFGVLVSCLGAEAEHQLPKRVMAYSYKNCCSTALSHWLNKFLGHLDDPTTFAPTFLPPGAQQFDQTIIMGGKAAHFLEQSLQVHTPVGTFFKGDLLHWNTDVVCVGIAKRFFMARIDGDVKFVAVVQQYLPVHVAPGLWLASEMAYVCTSLVIGALPFVKDGQYVRPRSLHAN